MKRRLFADADVAPTEYLLQKQGGSAMDYYKPLMAASGDYRKLWQYSRGNGWILKVDDMRKALYYLIAFEDGVEISLTVRDHERAAFLENRECQSLRPRLEAATKYSEGYALRFEIETVAACKSVIQFLLELMKVRPVATALTEKQKTKPNTKESKSAIHQDKGRKTSQRNHRPDLRRTGT
jgi:hypothetical protein